MATIIETKYRVTGFGLTNSKTAQDIVKGDTLIFTGGSTGLVKEVVQVSKMYVVFVIDSSDRFGNLTKANDTSRKYKISRELGIK